MNSPKSLLILTIFLVASCKKERPTQVWIYDDHEVTILNGNVQQVSISHNSEPSDFFYHIYFDVEGNLTYVEKRTLDIAQMEHETDSTIGSQKIKYSLQHDGNGNKIAIVGSISGTDNNLRDKSKGEYTNSSKWQFDKNGHAVDYIPSINGPPKNTGHYKYSAAGDLIEYRQSYSDFDDRDLYKYKYDQNHRMIEIDFYDDDWPVSITSFEYKSFDSNKNWTVRISHHKNYGLWSETAPWTDTLTRKITYY